MSRFRLTIESNLSDIPIVSAFVCAVCDRLGMSAADASSLELCAVEAVTNVIKHSYACGREGEVSLEIFADLQRLDLYVRDQGEPMREKRVAELCHGSHVLEFDPLDLAAVPQSGMGLQIIHQLMDETAYSVEAGINSMRLTKFLHPAGPQPAATPDAALEPTL